MKTKYEVYKIGSKVYAIADYYKDGKPTNYIAIFEASIIGIQIDYKKETIKTEISYWLSTPDGEEWGDSVKEDYVSDKFDELTNKMKKIWSTMANNH